MNEIPLVVEARALEDHKLWLRFSDGAEGTVDLSGLGFTGVFEPLADVSEFAKVKVHPEWGTVFWPNGADLDPIVLHSHVTGEPIVVNGVVVETPPYGAPQGPRKGRHIRH